MGTNNNHILHNYLSNLRLDVQLVTGGICTHNCESDTIFPCTNRLYYIFDREGKFVIDGEDFHTKRGSLILVPKGTELSFEPVNGEYFKRFVCHFTADFINSNLFDFLKVPYMIQCTDEREIMFIKMLFEKLQKNNSINDIPAAFRMQATLMKILSCFVDHSNKTSTIKMNAEKSLRPVLLYIEKNYKNDISIKELADYVHLHPNYFIKAFKKQFGVPPIQYINKLRLTKAKSALANTSSTIQEIAIECGFNGQSQFSKAFRQMFDISPSAYRKMHTEEK